MKKKVFDGFRALFLGAMNERLEFVIRDGEVVEESDKWRIFTVRRRGKNYRVAFQEIEEVYGKKAPELSQVVEVVEELASLVGNDSPMLPEIPERRSC